MFDSYCKIKDNYKEILEKRNHKVIVLSTQALEHSLSQYIDGDGRFDETIRNLKKGAHEARKSIINEIKKCCDSKDEDVRDFLHHLYFLPSQANVHSLKDSINNHFRNDFLVNQMYDLVCLSAKKPYKVKYSIVENIINQKHLENTWNRIKILGIERKKSILKLIRAYCLENEVLFR